MLHENNKTPPSFKLLDIKTDADGISYVYEACQSSMKCFFAFISSLFFLPINIHVLKYFPINLIYIFFYYVGFSVEVTRKFLSISVSGTLHFKKHVEGC